MASESVLASKLVDITECPICAEQFQDPRLLPCIHTFCLKCIEKWGENSVAGDGLACPMCRTEFQVPTDGLANLPRNFFMQKLLDVLKLDSVSSAKECDVCRAKKSEQRGAEISSSAAVARCINCANNMCLDCLHSHQMFRFPIKHEIVEFNAQQQQQVKELMQKLPEIRCDQHPDEVLKVYCSESECKMTLCMMCYITKHSGHKCMEVEKVAEEMSRQMKNDADGFSEKVAEIQDLLQKLTLEKLGWAVKACNAEIAIEQRAAEMKQLIEDIKVEELEQVNVAKKQQEKKLESLKVELERRLLMIESLLRYSEELRNKGTAVDIARAANSLHDRANELMQFDVLRLFDDQFSSLDMKFAAKYNEKDDLSCMFGQIIIQSATTELASAHKGVAKVGSFARLEVEEDRNKKLETKIKEMESENKKMKEDLGKLAEEKKKVDDEKIKLEQRIRDLNKALFEEKTKQDVQKLKNKKLEDERNELMEEKKKLEEKIATLETNRTSMEECKKAEEQMRQLNDDKIKLEEANKKMQEEINKLECASKTQAEEFKKVVDENSKLEQRLKKCEQLLSDEKAKHEEQKQKNKKLEDEKTKLKRRYLHSPNLQRTLNVPGNDLVGVAQCDDKLFAACLRSDTIRVYGPDNEQLPSITVSGLKNPWDIVACTDTKQLYIADRGSGLFSPGCVWRVMSGGRIDRWLTDKLTSANKFSFNPATLSVRSCRLLVTTNSNGLFLFGSDGVELKHINLSPEINDVQQSAETSRGTFIVCHTKPKPRIVEINADGLELPRFFSDRQQLGVSWYFALDSEDRVFVADRNKHRVLLLNSRLDLQRVLLDDKQQLWQWPNRLCFVQQTRQLIIACSAGMVQTFKIPDLSDS